MPSDFASSYEPMSSMGKAAIAYHCDARIGQVISRGAVRCIAHGLAEGGDEMKDKESSFTHLAKRPGVGSRSTRLRRWRTWRDVPHRERFVTLFVGGIAGKCQQKCDQ